MRDLEKAHRESMKQFQAKVMAEQKAQVEELTKKMENDRQEVSRKDGNLECQDIKYRKGKLRKF